MSITSSAKRWGVGIVAATVVGIGGLGVSAAANAATPSTDHATTVVTPAGGSVPDLSNVTISTPVEIGPVPADSIPGGAQSHTTEAAPSN